MHIEFKYAVQADLERIVETYNSTIPSRLVTADLERITIESKQHWFDSHSPEKRPLWTIYYEDTYAGWMSFNSFYGRPAYDSTVEVSIYIDEKFRGKGLGKICLEQAIAVARELEIKNLLGFIFGHNTASLNLFYQFDFEKWACLPGIANMDGILRDLIIVGKKI